MHVNHNHKLQYANSGKIILEWKAEIQQPRADSMEVKIALFIHDMKNPCHNISLAGNSIVYVPPTREKESLKILITFYRTASKNVLCRHRPRAGTRRFQESVGSGRHPPPDHGRDQHRARQVSGVPSRDPYRGAAGFAACDLAVRPMGPAPVRASATMWPAVA